MNYNYFFTSVVESSRSLDKSNVRCIRTRGRPAGRPYIIFLRTLRSLRPISDSKSPDFVTFVSFAVELIYGKIAATTSSRLHCTWASSVMPQVTATWQARRGVIPSLINRPA